MSRLRCWPGCLAVTTHPSRPGMLLEVIRLAPQEPFQLPHGPIADPAYMGPRWLVKPPGEGSIPLVTASGRVLMDVPFATCPDKYLRPITPPPGTETTDTEVPADAVTA